MRPAEWPGHDLRVRTVVAERFVVGWSTAEVEDFIRRLTAAVPVLAGLGAELVGSWAVPADETCLLLYLADDADVVRRAHAAAGLPVDRVVEADELEARRPG